MSQNPNGDPNYDPYGQNPANPSQPTYSNPGIPGAPYNSPQFPSNPNAGYGQYPAPNPPATNTPNSGYGTYPNPYAQPPGTGPNPYAPYPGTGYTPSPTSIPTSPSTGPNMYNPYGQAVASSQYPAQPYTNYPPAGAPGGLAPQQFPVQKKRGRGLSILIAVLALVIIIGGVIAGVVINNTNKQNTTHVHATATAQVQAQNTVSTQNTASAQQTSTAAAYPFSTNLVLNDPLTDNSKGVNWDNDGTNCFFSGSSYHVFDNQTDTYQPCSALNTNYSNFTFEVQMNITQGGQYAGGGLIFRGDESTSKYYQIEIDDTGYYYVLVSVDATGTAGNERVLSKGTTGQLTTGLGQNNLIAVVARGENITFYVNSQPVVSVHDSTYTHGQIGLEADYGSSNTEVVYSKLKVWQL
jgi:hypothetical protein